MRTVKPIAILLILSMLAACGSGPRPQIDGRFSDAESEIQTSEAEIADGSGGGVSEQSDPAAAYDLTDAEYYDAYGYEREAYLDQYHDEPSYGAQRAAEAALLVTGSAFLCTFVVVVLNGFCNFGVGFGYRYY